ncbi:MAG: hypothetical protein AAF318_01785 [Pseudomonadota bacterium]
MQTMPSTEAELAQEFSLNVEAHATHPGGDDLHSDAVSLSADDFGRMSQAAEDVVLPPPVSGDRQ